MRRAGKSIFSLTNRMVSYSIANVILLASIYAFFGMIVLLTFIVAAVIGIGLLETVNYIEHYGLLRAKNKRGKYEPVRHHHSWNSDHHYNGSKKYQILKSMPASPQMPTGYPGMLVLAFFQPLWFYVMNRRLEMINKN